MPDNIHDISDEIEGNLDESIVVSSQEGSVHLPNKGQINSRPIDIDIDAGIEVTLNNNLFEGSVERDSKNPFNQK